MRIVIAGAGLVGGELTRKLVDEKHDVIVIEPQKEVCDKLYAETGAVVINGNAAHIEILNEAEITKAEVLVAATGSDANNLACAILSKSLGVPRIVVRMRNPAYQNAYEMIGVESILRVTDLLVNQMIMEIEQPKVRRVTSIGGGRADIFRVTVPEGGTVAGKSVKEIAATKGFPSECIFVAAFNRKKEEFCLPRGSHVIREGDELFLISTAGDIRKAVAVLTATSIDRGYPKKSQLHKGYLLLQNMTNVTSCHPERSRGISIFADGFCRRSLARLGMTAGDSR